MYSKSIRTYCRSIALHLCIRQHDPAHTGTQECLSPFLCSKHKTVMRHLMLAYGERVVCHWLIPLACASSSSGLEIKRPPNVGSQMYINYVRRHTETSILTPTFPSIPISHIWNDDIIRLTHMTDQYEATLNKRLPWEGNDV